MMTMLINHRFTDFLVYEVDLDYNIIHIKSLDIPESLPKKNKDIIAATVGPEMDGIAEVVQVAETNIMEGIEDHGDAAFKSVNEPSEMTPSAAVGTSHGNDKSKKKTTGLSEPWPERFTTALAPFLSEEALLQVKTMFLEGPEPPRVSDSGWGGRPARASDADITEAPNVPEPIQEEPEQDKGRRGTDRGGRGGRGVRSGKGGGRGGRANGRREDTRKVLSNVRCHL
jgi:tRNA pseudouridine13 synthase